MSTVRVRAVVLGCRGERGNVGRRPTAAGLGPSRADRFYPEDDAMRFLLLDAIHVLAHAIDDVQTTNSRRFDNDNN